MRRRASACQLWISLLGYQLVWFVAVIDAGRGRSWPGIAAALLFVAWRLALSQRRALDLRLIGVALALGALIDGGAAASGLIHYAAASPAMPPGGAPLWILALWCAFALTMRSLTWLNERRWIGMLLGAAGAPLSYGSAARGWYALTFVPPAWRATLWLAAGWAVAMLLLIGVLPDGRIVRAHGR